MRFVVPLFFMLCLSASLRAAEEPRMIVSLSRQEVYEGQSVVFQVRVENVENPATPELRGTADFDVAFLGQQSLDSQQIVIINGVVRREIQRGRNFRYRLTPKRSGEIKIASPTLKVDGKTLSGTTVRLVVLAPSAQDIVAIELAADRTTVYPTQPFSVTLSVFVKELPSPVSDRDPLSVLNRPPMLHIPWLVDEELPHGLSPRENWQKWVTQYIDRKGAGFGINDLAQESMFSLFGESNVIAFRPKPQSVMRRDAQMRSAKYHRYDFSRTFTAAQAGPIALGPVTVEGVFAAGPAESGRLTGREVYAASKPLTVLVKDVPVEGRPESFVGAIGRFELESDLAPRQSKVGDPMTLTLTLRGAGSLAAVKSPDLGKVPAVAGRFKIYEATQKTEGEAARFVYALRPLAEGEEPFPAVPVSYFDVDRQQYVTLQSTPIPVKITKAERLSSDQIVASPNTAGVMAKEFQTRREGIFANITDVATVRDQSVRPARWLAGLGTCVAAYALLAVVTITVRRRLEDKASLRRRSAAARARQQLQAASAQWQIQPMRETADLIQDAFTGLVADVADLHDAGLTPKDVLHHVQTWDFPEALTVRLRALMDSCDAARYGGVSGFGSLAEEAQEVLDAVIETLRTQKRLR